MSITRMSAADTLALFDGPEPHDTPIPAVVDPEAPSGYAAYHPEAGVFIGLAPGDLFGTTGTIALWSGIASGGRTEAFLFDDPEEAAAFFARTGAARVDMRDALEYFAAPSGHWRDLQALGLNVHDMPFNGFAPSTTLH